MKEGAVAKWNHSTISGGIEILKSQYIVVKIHFATARLFLCVERRMSNLRLG